MKNSKPLDTSKWRIVVAYDGPCGTRGTVLSRHASYSLAERTLRRKYPGGLASWLAIKVPGDA